MSSKRLYRSSNQKMLCGVCGGIAEYFDIDPTLVRLVWAMTALAGLGILPYIVAAVIIPKGDNVVEGRAGYAESEVWDAEEASREPKTAEDYNRERSEYR